MCTDKENSNMHLRRFRKVYKIFVIICCCITIGLMVSSWFIKAKSKTTKESFVLDKLLRKKDWHDRVAMATDSLRTGLGEHGKPAYLLEMDKENEKYIYDQNGFNGLLSDRISLNRSLPDIRNKGCNNIIYLHKLPSVSIIIPFYNEHWSTLLRSIYSILNRSPAELIYEIILVDDFSNKDFLGDKLYNFVAENLRKVKLIRLNKRSGLIIARLAGAKIAKSEILLFLDSHVEVNYNWLPPLIEPIAINWRTVVCPFIDSIDDKNFAYEAQDEGARGAFDWAFDYKRLALMPKDLIDRTRPFRSPIMAGGLFAINTKFFWELGGYDEGLDIWGGEQYELSFKIWMCGGEIIDAPCSRVGHIYRGPMISDNPRTTNYLYKNYKRVAEVWMDEYAKYLYERNPKMYNSIDPGDLTKQKALRKHLQCKSFKWFMEEIAFDLPKNYPLVEPPDYAHGAIQSLSNQEYCLDTLGKEHGEISLFTCADDLIYPQDNQNFELNSYKELKLHVSSICLDASSALKDTPVIMKLCHRQKGNQLWYYDQHNKWLIHSDDYRCLEANFKTNTVYINDCNKQNNKMKWKFGYVNVTALGNYYQNKS